MKFEKNPQYFNIALYAFLVIAAAMILHNALGNMKGIFDWLNGVMVILQPFVIGFVLAYLLNPILRFMDDRFLAVLFGGKLRLRIRRGIGIFLTYSIFLFFTASFLAIIVPQLRLSLESIFRQIPEIILLLTSWISDSTASLTRFLSAPDSVPQTEMTHMMMEQLTSVTQESLGQIYAQLRKWELLPTVWTATARITTVLINVLVGIIISIYIMFDREKLFAQTKKLMTALFPAKANEVLFDVAYESNRIFSGFIVGKIIDSIIIGVICFIGMWLFKIEYAILISVIVGVTNVIPYFGPFIGAIPGLLILYIANPGHALWFLVFIFLLQQFDGNILGPKILGESTGLSAFWVIFSITLFSGIFGILGMFIGVPLFALIYYLVKRVLRFLLARKGESANTHDYYSENNPLIK